MCDFIWNYPRTIQLKKVRVRYIDSPKYSDKILKFGLLLGSYYDKCDIVLEW